jgi:glutathione synthase/RimK-type ligase-like ATP-grasp enzyme
MILGMYVNDRNLKKLYTGQLQWKMNFLAEEAAKQSVDLIVFSLSCIDWHNNKINGLHYNSDKKTWNMNIFTFPDIIYDRATFPDKEKEAGKFVRERFAKEYTIPFLNTKSYFNKLETHEMLSKSPIIAQYLPKTAKYNHPFQIVEFLDIYNSVYVKDSAGKLGKNIFKVQKASDELYYLKYQINKKNQQDKLTLQEIHKIITRDKLPGKNIIVQQGIDVALLDSHPFDIRCLVQKNGLMNWEVTDKSIRLAAPGSVVTNVSSGGEVKQFNEVVPLLFSSSIDISNEIDTLLIRVSSYLENNYGNLGELGIDIAIDCTGGIWLIEINGKPAKLCIYHSGNLELINKSCNNVISYSKQLFKNLTETKSEK